MANEFGMYGYAYNSLRRRFPAEDGWEIFPQDQWDGYRPDYVVEKRMKGVLQRVVAEVKDTDCAQQDHIDQLNYYVKSLAGRNVRIYAKILIVPAGCDCSIVGEDIEVIYLRG